ncbi:uncharacterized protein LOC115994686 isoform X7 [Quercus lobata]|uniref:uncharacterized protein LOC115994686 isoform X7 n=1 Tax=Quercus lobata TaxID=97700 RepID=UPI0012474229|nr:uncharacterized protein LOC115994686 isoform X7 [Quercus lobata]
MQELRCGDRENYHRDALLRHRGERQTSQGRYYRRPPTTRKLCFFCCRTARAIIGWKGQAFEATQSLRRMDQDSRTKMVPLERGYGDFLLMGFRQNHLTVGKTIRYARLFLSKISIMRKQHVDSYQKEWWIGFQ